MRRERAISFAAPPARAYLIAMRTIGKLASETAAARFSDFLYVRGIENQFEPEDDGSFSLWVHDDTQMAAAADLLASFRTNPDAKTFDSSTDAGKMRSAELSAERAKKSNVISAERLGYERNFQAIPYLTYLLIVISVAVAIYSKLGEDVLAIRRLFIVDLVTNGEYIRWLPALTEVRAGQLWRLFTPIFIHFGIVHILFNMMWLKDLGGLIENRLGSGYLFALVLLSAVLSNLAQYVWSDPVFGGMSGVVYALFGFLWIRGKCDPAAGWTLNSQAVYWMIGWFVICLVGIIANACHAVGLLVGMAWGFVSAKLRFSR